ncbi:hypothetical protein JKF63_02226 [Porcisia hertigi]|uniref:RNA editing complex protein MP46 n=1 Tax=Porcisia hertigi TaxID=2761500 RepID=A0A836L1H8_9TRYP|nr:hypothetical protein JKF63_02226 [Porcisia hertigi]
MRARFGRGDTARLLRRAVATPASMVTARLHPTAAVERLNYGAPRLWLSKKRSATVWSACSRCCCFTPARGMATTPGSACVTSCHSEFCLLCDTPYTSWTEHCQEHAHVARSAVCRFFVMPERSESIMQHLERHIALDFNEVDALTARKVERRRERLLAGLVHLVENGVLRDSIPTLPSLTQGFTDTETRTDVNGATLVVNSDPFLIRVLIGESFLRREVLDRCARLIPSLTGIELNSVVAYLTSTRQVARIFDELSLVELLAARAESEKTHRDATTAAAGATKSANAGQLRESAPAPSPGSETGSEAGMSLQQISSSRPVAGLPPALRWSLSREEKAYIMCACIGELHRFHDQERPRSVTSKTAADAIVLNVLAGHGRENLVSELVHETLQRIVDEGTAVWRQHQEDVKRRGLSSESHFARTSQTTAQSALDTDRMVVEGLPYMRTAPLLSHPSPRPASETTLDSAAAEQLVSSYLPFKDVDELFDTAHNVEGATTAAQPKSDTEGTCTTSPEFIWAHHTSGKLWEPLIAELRQRGTEWNRLPFAPNSPELKVTKKSG